MFRTASTVSSDDERRLSRIDCHPVLPTITAILRKSRIDTAGDEHRRRFVRRKGKPFLCVIRIRRNECGDSRLPAQSRSLRLRVVDVPPTTLRGQLVRNRLHDSIYTTPSCVICRLGEVGDCMTIAVVYLTSCNRCGDECIGETGRSLCTRVKEHLNGLQKPLVSTPFGEHRARIHGGAVFEVAVTILARERDISARTTLEVLWIAARNLKINRKDECIAVTQELAPFVDLCGFRPVVVLKGVPGAASRRI